MISPLRRSALLLQACGAGMLVVSAVALPWVGYRVEPGRSALSLHAGALSPALVAGGAAALALSALSATRRSLVVVCLVVAVSVGAFALAVVAALSRMADANALVLEVGSSSQTFWAIGSILGAVGGATMTLGAVLGLVGAPAQEAEAGQHDDTL